MENGDDDAKLVSMRKQKKLANCFIDCPDLGASIRGWVQFDQLVESFEISETEVSGTSGLVLLADKSVDQFGVLIE